MIAFPAVVIHGIAEARRALSPGYPVTLLSAPGAALAGGCRWWSELVRLARAEFPATPCDDLLDCADAPGRAMAALRTGQRGLVLASECPAYAAVAAAAATLGARVIAERPPALDLGEPGADRRLLAWLAAPVTPRAG